MSDQWLANIVGPRVKKMRMRKRWPMKRLAFELKVSVATISEWERGHRFPSAEHLYHLSRLFNLPACRFFCVGKSLCPLHGCQQPSAEYDTPP